jgi:hypothetical protein
VWQIQSADWLHQMLMSLSSVSFVNSIAAWNGMQGPDYGSFYIFQHHYPGWCIL